MNLSQVLLQHGADPNLQTDIKPKLAPPPASLPPAEAGLASNMSTATSSVTRLDDFAEATDQVGGGMISPTALGALSALSSVTAQVREGYLLYTHVHVVHIIIHNYIAGFSPACLKCFNLRAFYKQAL